VKLDEFIEKLNGIKSRHPGEEFDVVIQLENPSWGPVATTGVFTGFDWNRGKIFIGLEKGICRASEITPEKYKEKRERCRKSWGFPEKGKTGFAFDKGFSEGFNWGVRKLKEVNDEQL